LSTCLGLLVSLPSFPQPAFFPFPLPSITTISTSQAALSKHDLAARCFLSPFPFLPLPPYQRDTLSQSGRLLFAPLAFRIRLCRINDRIAVLPLALHICKATRLVCF
jgi:hypothetical protein